MSSLHSRNKFLALVLKNRQRQMLKFFVLVFVLDENFDFLIFLNVYFANEYAKCVLSSIYGSNIQVNFYQFKAN